VILLKEDINSGFKLMEEEGKTEYVVGQVSQGSDILME
jgi:hypothetical protein